MQSFIRDPVKKMDASRGPSRTIDRYRSIATQHDRYDVVSMARISLIALNRKVRGKLVLPPLLTVKLPTPHESTSSSVTMAQAITTPRALLYPGSHAANIKRRSQKGHSAPRAFHTQVPHSNPTHNDHLVSSETVENFCSLPLPEELLPMDDAPIDIYRSVVLIKEHRSEQLSKRR